MSVDILPRSKTMGFCINGTAGSPRRVQPVLRPSATDNALPIYVLCRLCHSGQSGLPDVDGCVYIPVQMGAALGAVPFPLL